MEHLDKAMSNLNKVDKRSEKAEKQAEEEMKSEKDEKIKTEYLLKEVASMMLVWLQRMVPVQNCIRCLELFVSELQLVICT